MSLIHTLIFIYIWILIAVAVMSWIPETSSSGGLASVRRALSVVTEPVLRPIRSIIPMPRVGPVAIDISVLVAIVLLEIVNSFIH